MFSPPIFCDYLINMQTNEEHRNMYDSAKKIHLHTI